LLDITSLGHANNGTVVSQVQDSVLLEDWAEHALDDDRGLWVAYEGRLFVKLSSEQVNTKISVLAGLTRLRDSDDLAWSTLQDQEITDSDEVAGDCDAVSWSTSWLDISDILNLAFAHTSRSVFFDDDGISVSRVERMEDSVSCTLDASSEAVVFTVVVVVTHLASWLLVDFNFCYCVLFNNNVVSSNGSTTLVFDVVGWMGPATVLSLSYVKLGLVRGSLDNGLSLLLIVVASLLSARGNVGGNLGSLAVVVASLVLACGNVGGDLRSLAVVSRSLISFSCKIYLGESAGLLMVTSKLLAGVLTLCELIGKSAVADTGLVNDTEFVCRFFFSRAFAVSYVDGLLFAESSIFPPDALGGSPLGDFPFYLGLCGSCYGSSVTPVRRREDTDWDGDAGVEVQVANFAVVLSSRLS